MQTVIAFIFMAWALVCLGSWQEDPNWEEHEFGYKQEFGVQKDMVDILVMPNLPAKYDWRTIVPLSDVKNQGRCGSCWAFGTTAALEEALRIFHVATDILSEQELVSCGPFAGCSGGGFAHGYQQNTGQSDDSEFPYQAQDLNCPQGLSHKWKIQKWAYIGNQPDRISAIKTAMLQYGVIPVTVTADSAMKRYKSGVFDHDNQGSTNHLVALVGWDDSVGVWIMRNSWGAKWGEQGYMRIKYGVSNIADEATFVVLPSRRDSPWVCTARNALGRAFTGSDTTKELARAKALEVCRAASVFGCYISRCAQ